MFWGGGGGGGGYLEKLLDSGTGCPSPDLLLKQGSALYSLPPSLCLL